MSWLVEVSLRFFQAAAAVCSRRLTVPEPAFACANVLFFAQAAALCSMAQQSLCFALEA